MFLPTHSVLARTAQDAKRIFTFIALKQRGNFAHIAVFDHKGHAESNFTNLHRAARSEVRKSCPCHFEVRGAWHRRQTSDHVLGQHPVTRRTKLATKNHPIGRLYYRRPEEWMQWMVEIRRR